MQGTPLREGHIRVANVRPAWAASRQAGCTEAQLAAVGLTEQIMADGDAAVLGSVTYAHMEVIASLPRPESVWMAAVEAHTLGSLGVVGLAAKTCATVADALALHQRFQHLTNRTATYRTVHLADTVRLEEHRPGAPRPGLWMVSDYALAVVVRLLCCAAGPVTPRHLESCRPRNRFHELVEAAFGAPVLPECAAAAVVLDHEVLARPLPTADHELRAFFDRTLAHASAASPQEHPTTAAVREAIPEALAMGSPTTAWLAKRLGLSRRTLQRRLEAEGHTVGSLVSDTRWRLAQAYLADRSLSFAEVAWLLGYQEESSFFRAFRRWSGTTPAGWRSSH